MNVDIAHIRDARPGNRFDQQMTLEERASFRNLILLCRPHHVLVDKTRPADFSPQLLEEWKHHREKQSMDSSGSDADSTEELIGVVADAIAANLRLEIPLDPAVLPVRSTASITPYQILWPKFAIVPFIDHSGALAELETWCSDEEAVSAVFIDGSGGMGKTRTAIELARRLEDFGWLTGFFRFGTAHAPTALGRQNVNRLIIFDYANERPNQINSEVNNLLSAAGTYSNEAKIRIVLITRGTTHSRNRRSLVARQNIASFLFDRARTVSIADSSLQQSQNFGIEARRRLFRSAYDAIRAIVENSVECQIEPELKSDTYAVPLFVILSAILAAYDGSLPSGLGTADILTRILDRESELFWKECPDPDPRMRERIVCIPTISPAMSEEVVEARLDVLGYSSNGSENRRLALWLSSLYEGPHWANGLEPDLLGEHLLASSLQPKLAGSIVANGTTNEASTALRVLARILATSPGNNVNGAIRAVADVLPEIVERWLTEEREGSNQAADALESATAFVERLPDDAALPHIDIPGRLGPAGVALAVCVCRKWLRQEETEQSRPTQIHSLRATLVDRLIKARAFDEALSIARTALAETAPHSDDLVTVNATLRLLSAESRSLGHYKLNNLPPLERALLVLSGLPLSARSQLLGMDAAIQAQYAGLLRTRKGSERAALESLGAVIGLRRQLVTSDGNAHVPALAASLRNRAGLLFSMEDYTEAATDITEAIELLRGFIDGPVSVFESDLAKCLDLAARILEAQDRQGWAAGTHREEAIEVRRRLASAFGAKAQLELVQALVRSASHDAGPSVYFDDAVSLASEMEEQGSLDLHQSQELAKLVSRLAKHPQGEHTRDHLSLRSQRILAAGLEASKPSGEAVRLHLTAADRSAREGRAKAAYSHYEKALNMCAHLDNDQIAAIRLPMLVNRIKKHSKESVAIDQLDLLVRLTTDLLSQSRLSENKPIRVLRCVAFLVGWLELHGGPSHARAWRILQKIKTDYVNAGLVTSERAETYVLRTIGGASAIRYQMESRTNVTPVATAFKRGPRRLSQSLGESQALQDWLAETNGNIVD